MYEEQATQIDDYAKRLEELVNALNIEDKKSEILAFETDMAVDGFWDNPESAQKIMQQLKGLKTLVEAPEDLSREIDDAQVLVELAEGESDETMREEIDSVVQEVEQRLQRLEITSLFSDPRDGNAAIISIHPGAGGTESCDWADMLFRMINRYCERQGFEVELADYQPGDEAGLKSATIIVTGTFAYGSLRSESGVHRLVRISPFDASARRHTSFAAIEVLPQLDDDIEIEIKDDDVKMDVFRSSGPGGQKVNKTSSAVRLTHIPTSIVVACQIERSQHRNRETAMNLLKAKLYDLELQKKEEEMAARRDGQQDVAWGSQIRSYVLHPYQMVKDHRTDHETGSVDKVLDGDLDQFVETYLKWNLERRGRN